MGSTPISTPSLRTETGLAVARRCRTPHRGSHFYRDRGAAGGTWPWRVRVDNSTPSSQSHCVANSSDEPRQGGALGWEARRISRRGFAIHRPKATYGPPVRFLPDAIALGEPNPKAMLLLLCDYIGYTPHGFQRDRTARRPRYAGGCISYEQPQRRVLPRSSTLFTGTVHQPQIAAQAARAPSAATDLTLRTARASAFSTACSACGRRVSAIAAASSPRRATSRCRAPFDNTFFKTTHPPVVELRASSP